MTLILLFVLAGTVWLSSPAVASSLYFDVSDVSVGLGEPLELPCGVEGDFRFCIWETEHGNFFQVEDVHAGLHPGMRASSNLTHNQCGIIVDAVTERNFGRWTCRVYFAGLTLGAERTVGKVSACPAAFMQIGTECFHIEYEERRDWQDARKYCQDLYAGADLAVLNDCHQFQLLFEKIRLEYPHTWYWIGSNDQFGEGTYDWVTGQPTDMGTPFWLPDKPNGDGDCAQITSPYGYFNDFVCGVEGYFVCHVLY